MKAGRKILDLNCTTVKQLCKKQYVTASDLAHMTGVSIRTITKIFYTGVPTLRVQIRTVFRIAQALKVPVDSIIMQDDALRGA